MRGFHLPRHLVALFLFALLTVAATWPLAAHFGTHVPGDPGDNWQFYWDLWWVMRALFEHRQSPLSTPLLYHPDGASLQFHTLLLAPAALMSPLTATLGPTFSYNFLVWLSFIGSGFGVYCLVLTVQGSDGSRSAAFLAGVGYAFGANRFSHMMGHLDLLSTQWLPFAALFVLRSVRAGGTANAFGLLSTTLLTTLTNWYLGLSLALLVLLLLSHFLLARGCAAALAAARRLALPLLVAAMLSSPVWKGMLRDGGKEGFVSDPLGDCLANSADVLGFVIPSWLHPWWGARVETVRLRLFGPDDNEVENTVFLGLVPLALAALGWREVRSWETRFFRWSWIAFAILALGPQLRIAGHTMRVAGHPLPMPYLALYHLPYGKLPHAPARFVLIAGLGQAVLAGLGARRLLTRAHKHPTLAVAGLAGLSLFENAAVPYPLSEVRTPPVYEWLQRSESGEKRALLEVPIPDWPAELAHRMLYQTRHGMPVFGGYVSRTLPPHPFHAVPGFRELKSLNLDLKDIDHIDRASLPAIARVALRAYGTTHVILLKDDFAYLPSFKAKAEDARKVVTGLLGEPVVEDEEAALFRVPQGTAPPFVIPERGFQPSAHESSPPERVVSSRARIGLWAPSEGRYEVLLTGRALENDRRVELRPAVGTARVALFTARSIDSATYACEATHGWQWIDLRCLGARTSPAESHADDACLVVTELGVRTLSGEQ